MPDLTERQLTEISRIVAEVRRHDIEMPTASHRYSIAFLSEIRTGRGHDIELWWADGEHLVIVQMDPYGHSQVGIGDVDWRCNSADEENDCETCKPAPELRQECSR